MTKTLLSALLLLVSTLLLAQSPRQLVVNETWNTTGNTKKVCYFYGNDNQLQRSRNYKRDEEGTGWTLVDYTVYKHDNDSRLTNIYTQPYRMINGELSPSTRNNQHTYEYNRRGQLCKVTYPYGETCTRNYDAEGCYVRGDSVNGKNSYTLTYEYADGKLVKSSCASATSAYASANYTVTYTYDHNGRMLSEYKTTTPYSSSLCYTTEWTYNEEGNVTQTIQYTLNRETLAKEQPKCRTEYTYENDGTKQLVTIKKYTYNSSTMTYTQPGSWNVMVYDIIDANRYSPRLSIEPANDLGTACLLFISLPKEDTENVKLHIYRNGFEIGSSVNFIPSEDNTMTYEDTGITTGFYEYFVEYEGHNISNIVDYDLQIPLPRPTNLRVIGRKVVNETRYDPSQGTTITGDFTYAIIQWDAPEPSDKATLLRTNIFLNRCGATEAAVNAKDDDTNYTTYNVELSGNTYDDIILQCVYDVGRSQSEPLRIYFEDDVAEGDVNHDGKVDAKDATSILNILLGKEATTAKADLNGDGKITLADLIKFVKQLAVN